MSTTSTSAKRKMQDTVEAILAKTGIDHAYDHAPADAVALPYIVWTYEEENFYADGEIYYTHYAITLTLYEAERSDAVESAVGTALAGRYAESTADYDEDSGLYEISYAFDIG